MDSPLKLAFQRARAENNIDLVLPVLLKSQLFIVTGGQSESGDFYLVPSPRRDRLCVTVAERVKDLQKIAWPKSQVSGEHLLRSLPANVEVIVVYSDGGDYITREHLQWYRSQLK